MGRHPNRRRLRPIPLRIATAIVLAAVASPLQPASAATGPQLVAASVTYRGGFTAPPCGFKRSRIALRAPRDGALLRRVSAVLPAELPSSTGLPVIADWATELLVLRLTDGRSYTYGAVSGELPTSLVPAVGLLGHELHDACTPWGVFPL